VNHCVTFAIEYLLEIDYYYYYYYYYY